MWNRYQVDSLHGYGDYDEASMFAFATGKVIESFYRYNLTETDKVVFQAHEWMTGMVTLYLQSAVPEIGTIFTTHATSIYSLHSWQQQAALRLSFRLQRRPDGRGAEHAVQTFH